MNDDGKNGCKQLSAGSEDQSSDPAATGRIKNHMRERMALLSSTLEMWCHQVLYVRKVYPKDTFCAVEFLAATSHCKANRHPGVVSYVSDVINVAVPAIFLRGVAKELTLVILNHASDSSQREIERYTLDFSDLSATLEENESITNEQPLWKSLCIEDLEREMLDLVLSVHSHGLSEGARRGKSNLSFKLVLYVPNIESDGKDVAVGCEELDSALSKGTWFTPSTPKNNKQLRPVHSVKGCMKFYMSY